MAITVSLSKITCTAAWMKLAALGGPRHCWRIQLGITLGWLILVGKDDPHAPDADRVDGMEWNAALGQRTCDFVQGINRSVVGVPLEKFRMFGSCLNATNANACLWHLTLHQENTEILSTTGQPLFSSEPWTSMEVVVGVPRFSARVTPVGGQWSGR